MSSDDRLLINNALKAHDHSLAKVLTSALVTELSSRGYAIFSPEDWKKATGNFPRATLEGMQRISAERNKRWAGHNGTYSTFERAAEVAGEVGEMINEAKKLRRVELGMPGNKPDRDTREKCLNALKYEAGDVFVTLLNVANAAEFSLFDGIQTAFNSKSIQMNFPERL